MCFEEGSVNPLRGAAGGVRGVRRSHASAVGGYTLEMARGIARGAGFQQVGARIQRSKAGGGQGMIQRSR